ncbi:MAG TPA: pyrroloquinoline quinone biosynthesis protein PqqB [Conexibacter sp.]|jgi:pyrroloquinoline quinone biosynthesis protein B
MRLRVLGAAAGGGYPQWNCSCDVCSRARAGEAQPRTQSSIALRGGNDPAADEPWVVVNASPDLRQQLAALPFERTGLRASPVKAVVLTDAEIDHTAGLLLLRESSARLQVYSTEAVRVALTDRYPVLRMLENYCGVDWHELKPGAVTAIDGTTLELEPFDTGGDAPLYMGNDEGPGAIGLTVRDRAGGGVLCYAPAILDFDDALAARMRESAVVLADGTFWTKDELVDLGLTTRDALAMGHAPLSGENGTLETLSALDARTILVHINNSNPILLDRSPQRALVEERGVEVGYDGLEVEL